MDQRVQSFMLVMMMMNTNNNNNNNNNNAHSVNNLIRLCDSSLSAFPILTKEQYIKRRDIMCAELHYNVCKEIGVILDNEHWYDRVPKSVETSGESKVTILWNQQARIDRTIPSNKPNIILRDDKKMEYAL